MKKLIYIIGIMVSVNAFSQGSNSVQNLELKLLKNQFDSSIIIANQILKTDSTNWLVHYYLGKAYQGKYKYFEALKYYEKANELDSANSVIENAMAGSLDFIGKDEEAIQIYYKQYLRDTLNIEPIVNLANIFRKTREYGSALHYYQKASAIDPENFYYYKQQGYCISKINMPQAAIYVYQIALMFNPYDLGIYQQLANLQNSEKFFSDAIETCKEGLKNYHNNIQLMKIKSYAQYLNKDFDSSIVGFSQLFEIGDTSYFNLKYRGFAYFEKKQFVNAINDLLYAYELNEIDAELCFYLGSALGRSNQNEEGLRYLNKSIRLLSPSPNELANIYSELANIYRNQKDYQKSLEHLKMAYKEDATPLLSFKMAQLYDYYLNNKKLAINYYDGYLTMSNEPDTLVYDNSVIIQNSFTNDSLMIKNAKDRIRLLNEELFFEEGKKE